MPRAGDPSPLVTGLEGAPSIYSFIHLFTASLTFPKVLLPYSKPWEMMELSLLAQPWIDVT